MPKYIVLRNFTEQGMKTIREQSTRRQARRHSSASLAAMGITAERYLTMGPYDSVMVVDTPDDETLASAMLLMGSNGHHRTLTMRAFTEEEAERIIGGIPSV